MLGLPYFDPQMLIDDLVRHVGLSALCCFCVGLAAMASPTFQVDVTCVSLRLIHRIHGCWFLGMIFCSILIFAASSVVVRYLTHVLPSVGGLIITSHLILDFLSLPPQIKSLIFLLILFFVFGLMPFTVARCDILQ